MPGSLLGLGTRVKRSESTRSDRSDISADSRTSGKKVSFNKAVRVKKYPRRPSETASQAESETASLASPTPNGDVILPDQGTPEKKFWFKVYKNRRRGGGNAPDISESVDANESDPVAMRSAEYYAPGVHSYHENGGRRLSTIDEGTDHVTGSNDRHSGYYFPEDDTVDPHSSQLPPEPPNVRKNLVKTIVEKFNEEAVLRQDSDPSVAPNGSAAVAPQKYRQDSSPPRDKSPSRHRSNPVVNGVKVIFGFNSLKKKKDGDSKAKSSSTTRSQSKEQLSGSPTKSSASRSVTKSPVSSHSNKSNSYAHSSSSIKRSTTDGSPTRNGHRSHGDKSPTRTNHYNNSSISSSPSSKQKTVAKSAKNRAIDEIDSAVIDYSKPAMEVWDSGPQLVSDNSRYETSVNEAPGEQSRTTIQERSQVWKQETRKKYYSPDRSSSSTLRGRRKAKSHSDLRDDDDDTLRSSRMYETETKGMSTSELHSSRKSAARNGALSPGSPAPKMRDIAVQCNRKRSSNVNKSALKSIEEIHRSHIDNRSGYRVLPSKDGYVSTFSDVPDLLDEVDTAPISSSKLKSFSYDDLESIHESSVNGSKSEVIYSQIDKSTKLKRDSSREVVKDPSPKVSYSPSPGYTEVIHESTTNSLKKERERVTRTTRSNRKSTFDQRNDYNGIEDREFCGTRLDPPLTKPWYDDDFLKSEVEFIDSSNGNRIRGEVEEPVSVSDLSSDVSDVSASHDATPASVIREMDIKKQEISYENVPHQGYGKSRDVATSGGLWFRKAEEDYRKEMAQSEVSYPVGSHVGNESHGHPRNYSPDRGTDYDADPSRNVRIMVNGKEVEEARSDFSASNGRKKNGGSPSSVQSDDSMYVRGGLAAAYQARQKAAALKRSNSSAVTNNWPRYRSHSSPPPRHGGSSAASAVSSSDSESNRKRRPVVMYIPGVSHHDRPAEDEDDRTSGISVARSQSMLSSGGKPKKYATGKKQRQASPDSERDAFAEEEEDTVTALKAPDTKKSSKRSKGSSKDGDLRRRHSMPKDTKFSWLKWKKKPAKPSREP